MTAFVRAANHHFPAQLDIVRQEVPLIDPDTGRPIGILARPVGKLEIIHHGDRVSTGRISHSRFAVRRGDRLLPVRTRIQAGQFRMRMPRQPAAGTIIATHGRHEIASQYDIVAINRGTDDGLQRGNLLNIYRATRTAADPASHAAITLPARKIGILMLFDVHPHASLGIILEASRVIRKLDRVGTPQS